MRAEISIFFSAFLIVGILFNFYLFKKENKEGKKTEFLTSERLIVFFVEIFVAVLGFGLTLYVTNDNQNKIEEAKALQMLSQAIEYTDREIEEESAYFDMYRNGEIETRVYLNSSVTNLDYYNNVMSNELILQNVNMVAYGYFMDYLVRVNDTDTRARTSSDPTEIRMEMEWRYKYLKKIRDLLIVCRDEMAGTITTEEANEMCAEINKKPLSEY